MRTERLSQPGILYISNDGMGFENADDFFTFEGHYPTDRNIARTSSKAAITESTNTITSTPLVERDGLFIED